MSTTVAQIEDMARQFLDDEDRTRWTDVDSIFPWLHRGRITLHRIRSELALSSDGATIVDLVELKDRANEITEPDAFAECLAWYIVGRCRQMLGKSSAKNRPMSGPAMDQFLKLAKM